MTKYENKILLRLRRQYSQTEAIDLCNQKINELEADIERLKIYNKTLEDRNIAYKEKLLGERQLSRNEINKLKTNKWVLDQIKVSMEY